MALLLVKCIGGLLSGILGNASQQAQTQSTNPINDILGSILGGGSSSADSGNPLGSIFGSVLDGNQQSSKSGGGLGEIFGSLFGVK